MGGVKRRSRALTPDKSARGRQVTRIHMLCKIRVNLVATHQLNSPSDEALAKFDAFAMAAAPSAARPIVSNMFNGTPPRLQ